ncbi:MAG: hypothetical protein AAF215_23945 [Cyanobacteria bacterium P01_A01_bin.123]
MSLLVDFQHLRRSLKSFLFPMFLLSVGAHAVVLMFVPMPGQQAEEEPIVQPLPTETETIQVARLPKLPEPEVEPTPEPKAEPNSQSAQQPRPQPTPAQAAAAPPLTNDETDTEPENADADTTTGNSNVNDDGSDEESGSDTGDDTDDQDLYSRAADRQNYAYNSNAGNTANVRDELDQWKANVLANHSVSAEDASIPELISVTYPLNECLDPSPGLVTVGVVIDGSGSLIEDPKIIGSSKYQIIDDIIKQKVSDHPFQAANEVKAYSFQIFPIPEADC